MVIVFFFFFSFCFFLVFHAFWFLLFLFILRISYPDVMKIHTACRPTPLHAHTFTCTTTHTLTHHHTPPHTFTHPATHTAPYPTTHTPLCLPFTPTTAPATTLLFPHTTHAPTTRFPFTTCYHLPLPSPSLPLPPPFPHPISVLLTSFVMVNFVWWLIYGLGSLLVWTLVCVYYYLWTLPFGTLPSDSVDIVCGCLLCEQTDRFSGTWYNIHYSAGIFFLGHVLVGCFVFVGNSMTDRRTDKW